MTDTAERPVKFDTPGRLELKNLGLGASSIARRMGVNAHGRPISPSQVSRWLNGDGRPDKTHTPIIQRLWGIAEESWLTADERADLDAHLASMTPAPTGTGG